MNYQKWKYLSNSINNIKPYVIYETEIKILWCFPKGVWIYFGTGYYCPIKTRKNDDGYPNCANENRSKSKFIKLMNVEHGVIYESLLDAASQCKIGRTSISSCLNGRSKTPSGYHWIYID